jgi:hypothetical protein
MIALVLLLSAIATQANAHSDNNDAHSHNNVACINHLVQKQAQVLVDPQPYSYLNQDGSYKKRDVEELETAPLRVHFDTFYLGGACGSHGNKKKRFFFFFFFFFFLF